MPLSMTAPAITSSICFKWILLFVFLVFKSTLGGDQGQEWRTGGGYTGVIRRKEGILSATSEVYAGVGQVVGVHRQEGGGVRRQQ